MQGEIKTEIDCKDIPEPQLNAFNRFVESIVIADKHPKMAFAKINKDKIIKVFELTKTWLINNKHLLSKTKGK